jgi:hypothetical protein
MESLSDKIRNNGYAKNILLGFASLNLTANSAAIILSSC